MLLVLTCGVGGEYGFDGVGSQVVLESVTAVRLFDVRLKTQTQTCRSARNQLSRVIHTGFAAIPGNNCPVHVCGSVLLFFSLASSPPLRGSKRDFFPAKSPPPSRYHLRFPAGRKRTKTHQKRSRDSDFLFAVLATRVLKTRNVTPDRNEHNCFSKTQSDIQKAKLAFTREFCKIRNLTHVFTVVPELVRRDDS